MIKVDKLQTVTWKIGHTLELMSQMKGATKELLRIKGAKDCAIHSSGTIARTTYGNSGLNLRLLSIILKMFRVEVLVQTRQIT